jgi:hypothetical protein
LEGPGALDAPQGGRRSQARSFKAQGYKNPFGDQFIPGFAAQALQHGASQDIVHVGVGESGARLGGQGLFTPLPDKPGAHFIQVLRVTFLALGIAEHFGEQVSKGLVVTGDAAGVGQELLEGDPPKPWGHGGGQLREDFSHGAVPPELIFLHHHGSQ